jgi:rhodanese-related sulfurtransferase
MSMGAALRKLFAKPYAKVTPRQATDLIAEGAILVDVREPYEWLAGHAPKARHIPLDQLRERAGEIPGGRRIVTICRSGARSARAAAMLAAAGREVSNVAGGMHAWSRAGLPVVAKGGGTGAVR